MDAQANGKESLSFVQQPQQYQNVQPFCQTDGTMMSDNDFMMNPFAHVGALPPAPQATLMNPQTTQSKPRRERKKKNAEFAVPCGMPPKKLSCGDKQLLQKQMAIDDDIQIISATTPSIPFRSRMHSNPEMMDPRYRFVHNTAMIPEEQHWGQQMLMNAQFQNHNGQSAMMSAQMFHMTAMQQQMMLQQQQAQVMDRPRKRSSHDISGMRSSRSQSFSQPTNQDVVNLGNGHVAVDRDHLRDMYKHIIERYKQFFGKEAIEDMSQALKDSNMEEMSRNMKRLQMGQHNMMASNGNETAASQTYQLSKDSNQHVNSQQWQQLNGYMMSNNQHMNGNNTQPIIHGNGQMMQQSNKQPVSCTYYNEYNGLPTQGGVQTMTGHHINEAQMFTSASGNQAEEESRFSQSMTTLGGNVISSDNQQQEQWNAWMGHQSNEATAAEKNFMGQASHNTSVPNLQQGNFTTSATHQQQLPNNMVYNAPAHHHQFRNSKMIQNCSMQEAPMMQPTNSNHQQLYHQPFSNENTDSFAQRVSYNGQALQQNYNCNLDAGYSSSMDSQASQQTTSTAMTYDRTANSVMEMNSNQWTTQKQTPSPPVNLTEEEKKQSTLWAMLNEVKGVDELALCVGGSRPLANLSTDDIDMFEQEPDKGGPLLTDSMNIDLSMEGPFNL